MTFGLVLEPHLRPGRWLPVPARVLPASLACLYIGHHHEVGKRIPDLAACRHKVAATEETARLDEQEQPRTTPSVEPQGALSARRPA